MDMRQLRNTLIRGLSLVVLLAGFLPPVLAQSTPLMKITTIGDTSYVSAGELEQKSGIAVKALEGQEALVVCHGERCALVRDYRKADGHWLIAVDALARSLDSQVHWSRDRSKVRLDLESPSKKASTKSLRPDVGQLAPDMSLRRLDGTRVALSDFRGKRVLINSWASW